MKLNPCKDCRMIPSVQYGIVSNIAYLRCKCGTMICGNETAETEWNERNPLPANRYLIEIEELKKQLENERNKSMWSIPVNVLNGNVCNKQVKIKKLEAELENKRQKIERQRAELEKLNERLARHCADCRHNLKTIAKFRVNSDELIAKEKTIAGMADVIMARDAKIAALEKRHIDSEKECERLAKKYNELRGDCVEAEERARIANAQLAEEKALNKAAHEYAELKRKELDLLEKMGLVGRIE